MSPHVAVPNAVPAASDRTFPPLPRGAVHIRNFHRERTRSDADVAKQRPGQ